MQIPGLRYTKHIKGGQTMGEEALVSKARIPFGRMIVDVTGIWGESQASYPGRSVYLT